MPSTVFGIGTRCYGKSNAQRRVGLCIGCRRESWLETHDARMWWVLVWLPIIPLRRKHVLDECIYCRRATVVDPESWDQAAYLDTSNAKAHFESLASAENAIRYHQCLLKYHQHEEAARLCVEMQRAFTNDALVHAHLGKMLAHAGDVQGAELAFDRAFKLNPELHAAREGVALRRIREGNLKGALTLLHELQMPGAGKTQDLAPLEELAKRYQGLGLHAEALNQFQLLIREQPARAQSKHFRDAVRVSESAVKSSSSCLPPINHKLRWCWANFPRARAIAGFVFLLTTTFVLHGIMHQQRHLVHVINGFLSPMTLRIDDADPIKVPAGHSTVSLTVGYHVAHVSGLVGEDVSFKLARGFWQDTANKDAAVLNIGGHAILSQRQTIFAPDGTTRVGLPEFSTGRRFYVAHGVDHAFEPVPTNIDGRRDREPVTLSDLQQFEGTAVDVISFYMSRKKIESALIFCEHALEADGECDDAAELYAQIASSEQLQQHAVNFLKPRLQARPVQIALHRAWQDVRRVSGNEPVLTEYRELVAKESNNGALVYLLGRLEDIAKGNALFQRATQLDPKLAWGWFAQGVSCSTRGDWSNAVSVYEKAVALRPANRRFAQKRDEALIGDGRWEQIKRDAFAQLKVLPNYSPATFEIIEAQAALGRSDEAESMASAYVRNNASEGVKRADLEFVLHFASYACGKFQAMIDRAGVQDSPVAQRARFQARLELGDVASAVKEKFLHNGSPAFADALAVAVGWNMAGNQSEADKWKQLAITSLLKSGEAAAPLVNALNAKMPPAIDAMSFSGLEAQDHSLVFAWFALQFPERSKPYAEMAKRFNIRRMFPYHLVKRVLEH